jgi:hypothetical protein
MESASAVSRPRSKGWIALLLVVPVLAAGHTGEKELDGRVDMILSPVVEQKG